MKETDKEEIQEKQTPNFFMDKIHWIASILLILGFIIMSINTEGTFGKSFHQFVVAPVLLLLGYSLFIVVIMRKIKD